MGAGFSTVTPSPSSQVSATSIAQTVWSYTPRSLTEIQNLVSAIQNNDPSLLSTLSDILYVPVPYFTGQVTADQAAAFIDNLIRNYNMPGAIANFITNYMYGPWTPNAVGAFLSSQNMSQTSVALLLAYAGATQMGQALSYLSGNYTNVVNAFNIVSPSSGAAVMANVSASQAATILSHPLMSVTQAAMILVNSNMSITQAAQILNNSNMSATQAASIVSIAVNYNATQVAMELSLLSTSQLANIAINSNMSVTTILNIISNSALAATAAQAILYGLANNYYYNKWINTVTANAGSTTISTNMTISSPLYSQNLTVASGVTVACGTNTCFFIAQSFNNQGTIVAHGAPGGTGGVAEGGPGGTGGGGVIIVGYTVVVGTITLNGGAGGGGSLNSNTVSVSNPGAGVAGVLAIVTGVTPPVGGTGGVGSNSPGSGEYNGGGGGSGHDTIGGTGGSATVYLFSSPNAMVTYILQGLSDWWLINVVGKAPPTTTPLLYVYGSGGGGGGGAQNGYYGGGGGGGGGGEAIIYGYVINGGTINAAGGSGGAESGAQGSGGGGGGGLGFVFYGSTASSLTVNVAGGAPGSGGNVGSTGSPGTAYIAQVTVNG